MQPSASGLRVYLPSIPPERIREPGKRHAHSLAPVILFAACPICDICLLTSLSLPALLLANSIAPAEANSEAGPFCGRELLGTAVRSRPCARRVLGRRGVCCKDEVGAPSRVAASPLCCPRPLSVVFRFGDFGLPFAAPRVYFKISVAPPLSP